MTKITFDYEEDPLTSKKAPFIPLTISDPFLNKTKEVVALLDTGYDGTMLIPYKLYEELSLYRFQYPTNLKTWGEMVTGERIELISFEAAVKITKLNFEVVTTVDTFIECQELLIGRELLDLLITTLNGPEKTLTVVIP